MATVVLIAMTLISAMSIGGFVFGLFGNFTSSADVQAQFTACSSSGNTCALTLYNSGTANTKINTGLSCATVKCAGMSVGSSSCAGSTGSTVPAGGSLSVTVTFPGNFNAVAGQQITGSLLLANNAIVLFSGTFS